MDVVPRAITLTGSIDEQRQLHLDAPLPIAGPSRVRVIILISEGAEIDEREWLRLATSNPAFDFLRAPEEDLYTLTDGKPFRDEDVKRIELDEATAPLAEYARDAGSEALVLTVNGKPVAALVPIENADLETVTLSTHPWFLALIERSRARQNAEGGISPEEMRRRLGLSG